MAPVQSKPYLILGIDSGSRNMGVCFYDPIQHKAYMLNVDLHIWDGRVHDMSAPYDYNERIIRLIQNKPFCDLLPLVTAFGYERQDLKLPCAETFRHIISLVEQTIRALHPHIIVIPVKPQDYGKYFQTKGTGARETNKEKSLVSDTLTAANWEIYNARFKKKDGIHSDPIEATHIAIYVHHHLAALSQPRLLDVRAFTSEEPIVSMTSVVNDAVRPEPTPTRKRRASSSSSSSAPKKKKKAKTSSTKKTKKTTTKKRTRTKSSSAAAAAAASPASAITSASVCRYCWDGEDATSGRGPLLYPCSCKGTTGPVHYSCIVDSGHTKCPTCKQTFTIA
jgi:hypothetical protein